MKEIVCLNGKFLPVKDAHISVLSPGFLYGYGVFETMRSCNKGIVYFDSHLKRIKDACKLVDIRFAYPMDKLKVMIRETIRRNGFNDSYVRLTLSKSSQGLDLLIIVKKYKPHTCQKYINGFRACIAQFRQNENSSFMRAKSTSYLLYRLSYLQAKKMGFDEAIILNNRGYICEGSRSNIFLIRDNAVFTPALECGCLDGITRRVVFDIAKKYGIRIYEGRFTIQNLYEADEAFLTNSLMGVMPLASVEKHPVGESTCGRVARFFIEKYKHLLKNGI